MIDHDDVDDHDDHDDHEDHGRGGFKHSRNTSGDENARFPRTLRQLQIRAVFSTQHVCMLGECISRVYVYVSMYINIHTHMYVCVCSHASVDQTRIMAVCSNLVRETGVHKGRRAQRQACTPASFQERVHGKKHPISPYVLSLPRRAG